MNEVKLLVIEFETIFVFVQTQMHIAFTAKNNGFTTAWLVFASLPSRSHLQPVTNLISPYVILWSACCCRTASCCWPIRHQFKRWSSSLFRKYVFAFFIKASATLILKLNKSFCFEFETPKQSQSRLYKSHPVMTATSTRWKKTMVIFFWSYPNSVIRYKCI